MPQPSLPHHARARHERGRPHQHPARTRGLKTSTFVTRVAIAASVALTGAFSAIAAAAFPGHADRGTPVTSEADRPPAPLVALPPPNSGAGGLPAPPPQTPIPGVGSGQVGSGGS